MRVATGTYTGDGTSSRSITGLGFAPAVVFLQAQLTTLEGFALYFKTSAMSSVDAFALGWRAGALTDVITSLDSDGFTVAAARGNVNTKSYDWVAMGADAAVLSVGSYAGNGADNRNITGVGFQPDVLFVMAAGDMTGNSTGIFRFGTQTGDTSMVMRSIPASNLIQAFVADGFQVGSDVKVNDSGRTYYYVAWKQTTGVVYQDSYNGNSADNRNIVQSDAFQPQWVVISESANGTREFLHRPASVAGDNAYTPSWVSNTGDLSANKIQQLNIDGFQVGTGGGVNNSGSVYRYVSFRETPVAPVIPPLLMARQRYAGLMASIFNY